MWINPFALYRFCGRKVVSRKSIFAYCELFLLKLLNNEVSNQFIKILGLYHSLEKEILYVSVKYSTVFDQYLVRVSVIFCNNFFIRLHLISSPKRSNVDIGDSKLS